MLSPHHITLGLIKQFLKVLKYVIIIGFKYMFIKFSELSTAKFGIRGLGTLVSSGFFFKSAPFLNNNSETDWGKFLFSFIFSYISVLQESPSGKA